MIFLPKTPDILVLFGKKQFNNISLFYIYFLRLQVAIIYFFAGIAKINYDWLINAQPMKIWLDARSNLPFIGNILDQGIVAYIMSWTGMIYDLSIPFLLLNKKTRVFGFVSVIIFHLSTYFLFHIGVFPWLMIILATVFFDPDWLENILLKDKKHINNIPVHISKIFFYFSIIFLIIQIILPIRHYFYEGDYLWTEKGFRFAWHVMIIEKTGFIEFQIKDKNSNKKWLVSPKEYLTPLQEKMMSTQPDMILQFAHYLKTIYQAKGYYDLEIKADSYVSLNGHPSKIYINPDINLLEYNQNSDVTMILESNEP